MNFDARAICTGFGMGGHVRVTYPLSTREIPLRLEASLRLFFHFVRVSANVERQHLDVLYRKLGRLPPGGGSQRVGGVRELRKFKARLDLVPAGCSGYRLRLVDFLLILRVEIGVVGQGSQNS